MYEYFVFSLGFYQFQNQSFAFCGKTIRSLRRNLITPVLPILKELGFQCHIHYSENCLSVIFQGRKNRFYLFGKDEGSAAMIQGITLAGVMFDEVAFDAALFCGASFGKMLCRRGKVLVQL